MKKSIFRSICVTVFSVVLVILVLITGVLYNYFTSVQREGMRMQTELIAKAVEDEGVAFFGRLDKGNYRITYIGPEGNVIYESEKGTGRLENHLDREEVREAMETGYGESYRHSKTLLEKRNYSAKKLKDGTIIRLSSSHYTILSLFLTMLPYVFLISIAVVMLSLILASRLSDSIVRPLNNLDLDRPMDNQVYEEVYPLLERIAVQQDELARTEQIRREFTANVSHELKTPLHSISGYAELLKNGIVREEDVEHFASRIYGEAQRMTTLIEDIMRLSHLDEGGEDLPREDADVYKLAEKTIDLLAEEARQAGVTVHLSGEHTMLNCYVSLVETILYNLCDNAIKYNHKDGMVYVYVGNQEDGVELSVKDTGIGIPDEYHERIFERFYRVDKSHSKEVGGTGLGLSIVKHAARLHDARITVESKKDLGTCITVFFPKKPGL